MQDGQEASQQAGGVTSGQRLTLLIVAVAGHGLKHAFNAAFFVLLPEIKAGLGLSLTQIGLMSAVRNVAGGLANIPAGYVGDRFANQRAEVLGLTIILVAAFALVIGLATNFLVALVASALFTIAITFWHPSAIGSLSREFENRRGFAISLHGAGGSVGETLGPVLAGVLLGFVTWRVILQGSIAPGLLFGVLIWVAIRGIPARWPSAVSMRAYVGSVGELLRNRRLLLVLLFAAGFAGGQSTIMTFLAIHLDEVHEVSSTVRGLQIALLNVGGIVTQPLLGYLSDRVGRKLVLTPSLIALGLTSIGLSVAPAGWMFLLVLIAMSPFLYPMMSLLLASAADLVSMRAQATTVSLVFGSAIVVSSFPPLIGGRLADAEGTTSVAFLVAAGVVLFTAFLTIVTRWQPTR